MYALCAFGTNHSIENDETSLIIVTINILLADGPQLLDIRTAIDIINQSIIITRPQHTTAPSWLISYILDNNNIYINPPCTQSYTMSTKVEYSVTGLD
jgi:hypothetical protein